MQLSGNYRLRSSVLWLLLVCVQACGCGVSQEETRDALKFFGMTYYNYHAIWRKPPASWDDVLTLAEDPAPEEDRTRLLLVREAGYTVSWGVDPKATDASEVVLAYLPKSVTDGGDVLFVDGSVRLLTGAELNGRLENASEQARSTEGN